EEDLDPGVEADGEVDDHGVLHRAGDGDAGRVLGQRPGEDRRGRPAVEIGKRRSGDGRAGGGGGDGSHAAYPAPCRAAVRATRSTIHSPLPRWGGRAPPSSTSPLRASTSMAP